MDRSGWGYSIGFHLLLLFFFLLYRINLPSFFLDFTPVEFLPLSSVAETGGTSTASMESSAPVVELPRRPMLEESSPLLQLPDRARPPIEAVIPLERPEAPSSEPYRPGRALLTPGAVGRSDRPTTQPLPIESSWLEGERDAAITSPLAGDEMFKITWQGVARVKVSGELPKYPPGVNRAATVRLTFDVDPDGSVTFVAPSTKGVPELEKAAMDALRSWRFNALDPASPKMKQRGEITFVFTLK